MFRLLVTGSRRWPRPDVVVRLLDRSLGLHPGGLTIVHGACSEGVDQVADDWCAQFSIPVERFPADWDGLGRRAGMVRNQAMVDSRPDGCYAFIWRASAGASHCARVAEKAGVPVHRWQLP